MIEHRSSLCVEVLVRAIRLHFSLREAWQRNSFPVFALDEAWWSNSSLLIERRHGKTILLHFGCGGGLVPGEAILITRPPLDEK